MSNGPADEHVPDGNAIDGYVPETEMGDNPLLVTDGYPRYDEITPGHIKSGVQSLLASAEEEVRELERTFTPTWAGLVQPLEDMDRRFEYGWSPIGHLLGVKNSPELRTAYEEILPEVINHSLRVSQSEPIYRGLISLRESDEYTTLSSARTRIVDAMILQAELAGIGLAGDQRDRFNEITRRLSQLGTEFSNHVLDATKRFDLRVHDAAAVEGMPESLLGMAAESYKKAIAEEADDPSKATERNTVTVGEPTAGAETPDTEADSTHTGPWRFTLDGPSFIAFMKHCRRGDLRERMYRAYVTRAADGELDNGPLIDEILDLRQEKARLLGYGTFAEMSLARKMAESVEQIDEMLERLRTASYDHAIQDLADLKDLADGSDDLKHWDVSFWSERLREQRFEMRDEDLRPYFPLEKVLDGLFSLLNRLFAVTVKAADGEAPIWHDDVRFFAVENEAGERIAAFYLDPYSRPENKRGGAWMADCLTRRTVNGTLQIPVAHLICNSTPPVGNKPSLMTFREVETLFHEFGHGLQHMLTTVDDAGAAGINNVEWDAVELPSQFMENWCYHRPTLLGLTAHYKTGEPLPEEYFEKIVKARTFQSGSLMLRQLQFGMIDLELHHRYDRSAGETPFDVHRRIAAKTAILPPLPENRFLCGFEHIFAGGYAAGYYSYKWAEVLSADAFAAFEEANLDNEDAVQEVGHRFRDTVLAEGGSRHPMEIFKDFRGREPSPEPLLRHTGLG